jgi:molecular chaperone GrpE
MKHPKKHPETEETVQNLPPLPESVPVSPEAGEKTVQAPQELESLRSQLEALQKERDDLFARLQRLSADYANYQKRVSKQIADSVMYEKEKLIRSVLPVCDNFELTIQKAGTGENSEIVLAGVRIIYEQMMDLLKAHEVEPIKVTDTKFDPSRHEALMQRCDLQKEDGLILEECQRGYILAGKVLRPSKVIVNKAPTPMAQEADARLSERTIPGEEASDGE